MNIELRPTTVSDLQELFVFQLDEQANYMAAFTAKNPEDKEVYLLKYTRFLTDQSINNQTIIAGGLILGSIAKFKIEWLLII